MTLEEIIEQQNELLGKLKPIAEELAGKADLTADRLESLTTAKGDLTDRIQKLEEVREHEERAAKADAQIAEINALLAGHRTPSRGIGPGKASGTDDGIGFYSAVAMANSRDHEQQQLGKARLAELGSTWYGGEAKATIGDSNANGGYLVPVMEARPLIETATAEGAARQLFTVIDGVNNTSIPINYEGTAPTRAAIWTPGQLKENSNFTVSQYSATMYTLARIFDVGNALLRKSSGAAEKSVRSKLARAFALGEDYYAISGNGTTEPKGLLTALAAAAATYTTSFTPSATTLAGSVSVAIAKAAGALANRSRIPDGALLNSGDFWTMIAQGTDSAGFFFSPQQGPPGINAGRGTLMAPFGAFGVRVAHSPSMTTDKLVVGEFKSAELFFGEGYRVDTSDQAGTRWDYNLTGFRGEEEMAFNADPYVASGMFQLVADLVP